MAVFNYAFWQLSTVNRLQVVARDVYTKDHSFLLDMKRKNKKRKKLERKGTALS